MATVELDTQGLEQALNENDIILLDLWAEWCGPCKQFAPVYDEASERHDDVLFGKVDVDSNPDLAAQLGVQSIPTLIAVREGVAVFNQSGVLSGKAIDDLVKQIRDLDMEEVHAAATAEPQESDAHGHSHQSADPHDH